MLEVRLNENETMINVCGTPVEVMTDITMMLNIIYKKLDNRAKGFFKESLESIVKEEIYAKSAEEVDKLNKKEAKEMEKKQKEKLNELLKDVPPELIKMLKDALK